MTRALHSLACAIVLLTAVASVSARQAIEIDSATIADLNAAFKAGTLTSEKLVELSLARIDAYNRRGPSLRAMIAVNPKALDTARALDTEDAILRAMGLPATNIANLTGIPDLVVPAGFTGDRQPVGISLLGEAFSEGKLLAIGYSFEQATRARRLPVHTPRLHGDVITTP